MDQKDVDEFKKASEAYRKKVCKTKETARQALVDLGTHTKDGKIHENYGGPGITFPR